MDINEVQRLHKQYIHASNTAFTEEQNPQAEPDFVKYLRRMSAEARQRYEDALKVYFAQAQSK